MPEFRDWTEDLKRWGESRDWRCLPRRHALHDFREFCDWDVPEGFHVADALHFAYNALMRGTQAERDACQTSPDVKALMKRQDAADESRRQEFKAEQAAARHQSYLELLAAVDRGQRVRVWPQGLWVEDVLHGRDVQGRAAFDEVVAYCRDRADAANCRLMVAECCVMAALLDERGLMIDNGLRVD